MKSPAESDKTVVMKLAGVASLFTCAFFALVACLPAGKPGNIAAFAFKQTPGQPTWRDLEARAETLEALHGLEFKRFVRELAVMNPHDAERLLL